jgi:hypothetical protein
MAEIEKKVEDLTLNTPAAGKPQGKPKEKKAKKPVAEGSYPLEVPPCFLALSIHTHSYSTLSPVLLLLIT